MRALRFLNSLLAVGALAVASPTALASALPHTNQPSLSLAQTHDVELAQRGMPRVYRPYRPPPKPYRPPEPYRPNEPVRIDPSRPGELSRSRAPLSRVPPVAAAAVLLGQATSNPAEAKFLVTRRDGEIVLQTNFTGDARAASLPNAIVVDAAGGRHALDSAALHVLHPEKSENSRGLNILERMMATRATLANAEVYVDQELIGTDGRPPLDLSGAGRIRLVRGSSLVETGRIEPLTLEKPPPPLIEALSGCCFKGRPPGWAASIRLRLESRRIEPTNSRVLSLVIDTATSNVFRQSRILQRMGQPSKPAELGWRQFLEAEMGRSRGRNLILLTHVLGSRVVVENPRGDPLFEIEIAELQKMATAQKVDLILLGCETSARMNEAPLLVGVIGKYNTARAAERLSKVLGQARNGAQFMEALASRDLMIVAQPGNWAPEAAGGTLYARASAGAKQWVRLMRVWFLGGQRNG